MTHSRELLSETQPRSGNWRTFNTASAIHPFSNEERIHEKS
jgi:hypothetical protein